MQISRYLRNISDPTINPVEKVTLASFNVTGNFSSLNFNSAKANKMKTLNFFLNIFGKAHVDSYLPKFLVYLEWVPSCILSWPFAQSDAVSKSLRSNFWFIIYFINMPDLFLQFYFNLNKKFEFRFCLLLSSFFSGTAMKNQNGGCYKIILMTLWCSYSDSTNELLSSLDSTKVWVLYFFTNLVLSASDTFLILWLFTQIIKVKHIGYLKNLFY